MSAAEFIIKNQIDLFSSRGHIADQNGNILMESDGYWLFRSSDGHFERVYL